MFRHGYPGNGNSYVAPDSPKPIAGVGFSHSARGYCISSGASHGGITSTNRMEALHKEIKDAINVICLDFVKELIRDYIRCFYMKNQYKKILSEHTEIECYLIRPRERPPPLHAVCPTVYVVLRPDNLLYVGETDDLDGRVRSYRSKKGMHNASFFYILLARRSMARKIRYILLDELPERGFHLSVRFGYYRSAWSRCNYNDLRPSHDGITAANPMEALQKEVQSAINVIFLDFIMKHVREKVQGFAKVPIEKDLQEQTERECYLFRLRGRPPHSKAGCPTVYVVLRPDKKLYVGEVHLDFCMFS